MCYVIVTSRTLLWTLLTISSAMAMLAAVVTPQWLVGVPEKHPSTSSNNNNNNNHDGQSPSHLPPESTTAASHTVQERVWTPTVGLYNRCTRVRSVVGTRSQFTCATFVTSFSMPSDEFPDSWKASLFFFSLGLVFMATTVFTSVIGCCVRAIAKKSIFTLSGTVQATAGLCYILALILYPGGWGSRRVRNLCGEEAEPYVNWDCSLGWAFYLAIGATMSTFLCSFLSVQAEISTSSDSVQEEILQGKNPVCLL